MKKIALLPGLMVLLSFCLLFTSCKEENKDVEVTGVTLSQTTLTLEVGKTATLTATVAPGDATNKEVTWTSSNASIATVNAGKVTAIAAGSATITVTTKEGNKTATCAVTVNEAASAQGIKVTFGSEVWTAGATDVYERSLGSVFGYDFWAGKTSVEVGNFPMVNFIGPNATGTTQYTDGEGYYFEYFERTVLTDGQFPYGDWWVESGTVNVTKYGSGKMSGTANTIMYDAFNYLGENGSGEYITRNLSITFTDVPVEAGAKMGQALKPVQNRANFSGKLQVVR